jgi:hypothetical protein
MTLNVDDKAFRMMMAMLGQMNDRIAAVDLRTRHLAAAEAVAVAERVEALVATV